MSDMNGGSRERMRSQERPEVLRRRRRKRIVWLIVAVVVLGGGVWMQTKVRAAKKLLASQQWEERTVEIEDVEVVVAETGILEPRTQVIVKSQVAAQVEEILVEPGDMVRQGDVVARLDPSRVQQDVDNRKAQVDSALAGLRRAELTLDQTGKLTDAQLASAKASLVSAQAALGMSVEGLRPQDVQQAEERVAQRQADLEAARAQLAEMRAGYRPQEIEEQEESVRQAAFQVAQAETELGKLLAGSRAEEIQESRAQLEQAKASESAALAALQRLRAGSRPQEVRQAEADFEAAQAKLAETEATLSRQSELHDAGFVSDQDLDGYTSAYVSARAAANTKREALGLLREGPRVEDIRAAEADLVGAQAGVRAASQRLALAEAGPRAEDIEKQRRAIDASKAALAAQTARLELMRTGTRAEQITQQEAAVRRLEASLREAEAALDAAHEGSRPQEIEQARAALAEAETGVSRAMAEGLNSGVRAQDITDSRAQLQSAKTQLLRAQEDLMDCTVRSPIEGIVLLKLIQPGELASSGTTGLTEGTPLITVGDTNDLIVRLEVHEVDVINLKVGLEAEVRFDAIQGEVFKGAVDEIAPQSSAVNQEQAAGRTGGAQAGVVTFRVQVRLDEMDERLRPGMSARVKVVCDKVSQVPTVTIAALRSKEDKTYVLLPATEPGGEPVEQEVELGVRGPSTVEIKSGLAVGDKYLIRKPDTKFDLRREP